jgi:hypothetical protein
MNQDLDVVGLLASWLQSFCSKPAENKGMLPNAPYLLACVKLNKTLWRYQASWSAPIISNGNTHAYSTVVR